MDKYIVRTPRHVTKVLREVRQEGPRVQSRLEALPGVVVVEELVRAKELLEREEEAEERKVKVLRQLLEKRPSTKLLEETRIGRTVRRLSEGEGEVARLASRLYKRWKREVERRVELSHTRIEVRSDQVRYLTPVLRVGWLKIEELAYTEVLWIYPKIRNQIGVL